MKGVFRKNWGKHKGKKVDLIRFRNSNGSYVELTNYGASIVSIFVPDKNGELGNVVLGFDNLEGYINDKCYIGPTIGRFANRIANAEFTLDGNKHVLERNDGKNSNHGGFSGYNTRIFDIEEGFGESVTFVFHSKDGEGGYPGNLSLRVEYSWSQDNELIIRYTATTDKKTIANFTNHAYFNLSSGLRQIFDHRLTINADEILETDDEYIPSGRIIPAGKLLFQGQEIGECMQRQNDEILGLNHYFILNGKNENNPVSILEDEGSGRMLEVRTSYPGLMLYTGDHLSGELPGYNGKLNKPFDGLCLECQFYPDSPNHAAFPTTILEPGKQYEEFITYKFKIITTSE